MCSLVLSQFMFFRCLLINFQLLSGVSSAIASHVLLVLVIIVRCSLYAFFNGCSIFVFLRVFLIMSPIVSSIVFNGCVPVGSTFVSIGFPHLVLRVRAFLSIAFVKCFCCTGLFHFRFALFFVRKLFISFLMFFKNVLMVSQCEFPTLFLSMCVCPFICYNCCFNACCAIVADVQLFLILRFCFDFISCQFSIGSNVINWCVLVFSMIFLLLFKCSMSFLFYYDVFKYFVTFLWSVLVVFVNSLF